MQLPQENHRRNPNFLCNVKGSKVIIKDYQKSNSSTQIDL